jgi:hypothetical protein
LTRRTRRPGLAVRAGDFVTALAPAERAANHLPASARRSPRTLPSIIDDRLMLLIRTYLKTLSLRDFIGKINECYA